MQMLKKLIAVLIAAAVLAALFVGCSGKFAELRDGYTGLLDKFVGKVEPMEEEPDDSAAEEALRTVLKGYAEGSILWFECRDFDKDGTYEAFGFTAESGTTDANGGFDGSAWFVTKDYAVEMLGMGSYTYPKLAEFPGGALVLINQSGEMGLTYIFGVENSKVYQPALSGKVRNFSQDENGDFTAWDLSYDRYADEEESAGEEPTLKPYWFYYEDGEFREYGARDDLHRSDLKAYPAGAEFVNEIYYNGLTETLLEKYYPNASDEKLEEIAENAGYFDSILLRENGILQVNFKGAYEDWFYVTFRIGNGDLTLLDEGRGYYKKALIDSIATYPEESASESEAAFGAEETSAESGS
jgi:hypothetical protein